MFVMPVPFAVRGRLLATLLLVAAPSAWAQAPTDPSQTSDESGGIGEGDLDGLGGGQPESQPQQTNQQMSREEAIEKIIAACRQNPQMAGCVKLRRACEEKRGAWQNDMARICPEVVGGGGGGGGGQRYKDISADERDKVVYGCRKRPDLEGCGKLRRLCGQAYGQMGPNSQSMCRQLGWVGGGGGGGAAEKPYAMHAAYAFTYMQNVDADKLAGNGGMIGGHVGGRGFATDSIAAAAFDLTIASADTGWYYDFSFMAGAGGWFNNRFGIGLNGGIRGSGISGGGLELAWGIPVDLNVQVALGSKFSLMAYARPIWHLGEAGGRKRQATIASFADEFELGANVVWAKVLRAGSGTDFGLLGGVVYHEWADTQYVGIRLGFGFTTRD